MIAKRIEEKKEYISPESECIKYNLEYNIMSGCGGDTDDPCLDGEIPG